MEALIRFWMLLCHWVQFDTAQSKEEIDDTVECLARQHIPVRVRTRRARAGGTEYVLYVKDADRDLARYSTGWRYN